MARVSFTEVWDQTRAFVAKEVALLAPVALTCFALPLMIWSMIMPEAIDPAHPPAPGPWVVAPIPLMLIQLVGWLALVSLVLRPAISVKEAMQHALRKLPAALAVVLVLLGIGSVMAVALAIVTGVVSVFSGAGKEGAQRLFIVLMIVALLIVTTRLIVLWPNVADGQGGPIRTVQRTLRLTKGDGWRLLGLLLLAAVVSAILSLTAEMAGGSVLLLLGRMVGNDALGRSLALALNAIVVGLWQMVTVVYVAFLYRALVKTGKAG
jgi:hypothetical protein